MDFDPSGHPIDNNFWAKQMTESGAFKGWPLSSVLFTAVGCLWLFTGFATVGDAAVLGIDFGNEFLKVKLHCGDISYRCWQPSR